MRFLFLLFIIIPIAEMWILIEVGQWLGALPTILLVMLTAMLGISLLRMQGVSTLTRAQQRMQQGEMPAQEMLEGIALAVGGALLLTPGFMTDAFGFACLIPASRKKLAAMAVAQFSRSQMKMYAEYHTQSESQYRDAASRSSGQKTPDIIEGEYKKIDE